MLPFFLRGARKSQQIARVAQLVERHLAKVEVAGSSPVSRSFNAENEVIHLDGLIFALKSTSIETGRNAYRRDPL